MPWSRAILRTIGLANLRMAGEAARTGWLSYGL